MAPGVGDTLREAREERGIAIEEVAAATKIQPRLLRAIEAEDWDALPGEFYASRFTRTYAEFLGLDGAPAEAHGRAGPAGRRGGLRGRGGAREPRVEPRRAGPGIGRRRARRPGSRRGGTGAARVKGGLGPGLRPVRAGVPLRAIGAIAILIAIVVGFVIVVSGSGGGGDRGRRSVPANPVTQPFAGAWRETVA